MKTRGNGSPVNGKESVAYADLLSQAHEAGLKGIQTQLLVTPNDENGRLAIVKATVEIEVGHFEGIGDADQSNVEAFLVPHLIRVAEDRAKARALRDAVNCGIVSSEELGGAPAKLGMKAPIRVQQTPSPTRPRYDNGSANRGTPPRAANRSVGHDGPMSEAQRRYLFRLVAGRGYVGSRGEEYLKVRLGVERLSAVTRADASALIDELVQSSAPERGGNGAERTQHQH